ncbi:MAG: MFS transporter [Nitrososphaerota archaeon]|nr:MFS transporter [Nitrososphaerota archaeon]
MTSAPASVAGEKNKGQGWMWSVLPLNAGVQGFSTMVPLYILFLGGNVVQVALFTTLYNAVLIPSSIFWGRLTDRWARRRVFFVITCLGTTVFFAAMFLLPNLDDLAALYGGLGFVVSANAVAANLLVMETSEKKNWISSYSNLSLVSNLGSIIGVAVGFVWASALPLGAFLIFCAAATAASVVLSYALISEPVLPLEAEHAPLNPARVLHGVTSFVHHFVVSRGMAKDALRVLRATRAGAITGRVLLFFSTFLFTTSSAFLNTSFSPFLVDSAVTDNEVFAISLVNIIIQTMAYRWMGSFIKRLGGVRIGPNSVLLRTFLYMVFAGAALVSRGTLLFLIASVVYAATGVAYALWNSSTSVTLLSNLGPGRQGNLLGGYAALGALGTVAGSLFTGYISYYDGYSTTFTVAAAIMLGSFFVLEAALKALGYTQRQAPTESR